MNRDPVPADPTNRAAAIDPVVAAVLVFGASAGVLVVEIVSLRLLAPYLGLTLETSTTVIGLALAAIALGAWTGGRLADVVPARRMLPPLFGVAGLAVALTPSAVRATAATGQDWLLLIVASLAIIVPGTTLAAVTPMVTKLRLTSLTQTGAVVGRLSGIGTAGAIVGTVVTGFVLISRVPVSGIMIGLGAVLVLGCVLLGFDLRRRAALAGALLLVVSAFAAVRAPGGCDVETIYHCAVVVADPDRPSGRTLVLDGARHSYVDLDDPAHLEFPYVRAVASVIDSQYPPAAPLRAYHLGGGGLTVPRYLEVTRPGSTSVVSEVDPGVVAIARDELGFGPDPAIDVRVEDGRLGLREIPAESQDLVVGDAFGGVSPPWHLTTVEAVRAVDGVLDDDGSYVVNLIDHGSLGFARAELATLGEVFTHVALVAEPDTLQRSGGGNLVGVASQRPLDLASLAARMAEHTLDWGVLSGPELQAWVGDARVLTDDRAPVDQLLTPYGVR